MGENQKTDRHTRLKMIRLWAVQSTICGQRGGGGCAAACTRSLIAALLATFFCAWSIPDPHRFHFDQDSQIQRRFISSMDPVSITLGVAPLCLAALKGSKRLKEKLKAIHDYEGEIKRFRAKFKTNVSVFRDESQLLLQATGIQRGLAAKMIHDYSHESWTVKHLEQDIQEYLGEKYTEVKEVGERIRDQLGKVEDILGRLEAEEGGPGGVCSPRPPPHRGDCANRV